MSPRTGAATALAALLMMSTSALAQEEAGRYSMAEVENGILRLDTKTGDVSHCQTVEEQWICRTAADDREALDDEIDELNEENEELRRRIAELETEVQNSEGNRLGLPNDEELEEVIGFMERLMRRFYAFAESLRNEPAEET